MQRRSVILIDRKFQLRFAFYVCSWLFGLSLIYPLIIYNLFEFFLRYIAHDPNGPSLILIQNTRQELLWVLVLLQLVFLSITFLISIFMSHKIAGPLYKLRQFFDKAKDGALSDTLKFRKADHFQSVAEKYNEMAHGLLGLLAHDRERLSSGIQKVEFALERSTGDGRKALEEALTTLREVREHIPH